MHNRTAEKLKLQYEAIKENTPKEMINDWLSHPCTEMLLLYLGASYETIKDHWANGSFTRESMEGTCQKNAEEIGRAGALLDVIEVIKDTGVDS